MANIDDFQNLNEGFAADAFQSLEDEGLVNFQDRDPSEFSFANQRANRTAALRQLSIQRKKLEFQKKTGLRDIGQARTAGLRGAINDALQRGIFNSGIRIENEALVNREADEAKGDLKTDIQFALDELAARRQGLAAQKFGNPNALLPGQLSEQDARELAQKSAQAEIAALNAPAAPGIEVPTFGGIDEQPTQPNKGIVQVERQVGGPS